MNELRTYHCNICGALLMVGEAHTCDSARIALVDRIADLLSMPVEPQPEILTTEDTESTEREK